VSHRDGSGVVIERESPANWHNIGCVRNGRDRNSVIRKAPAGLRIQECDAAFKASGGLINVEDGGMIFQLEHAQTTSLAPGTQF